MNDRFMGEEKSKNATQILDCDVLFLRSVSETVEVCEDEWQIQYAR